MNLKAHSFDHTTTKGSNKQLTTTLENRYLTTVLLQFWTTFSVLSCSVVTFAMIVRRSIGRFSSTVKAALRFVSETLGQCNSCWFFDVEVSYAKPSKVCTVAPSSLALHQFTWTVMRNAVAKWTNEKRRTWLHLGVETFGVLWITISMWTMRTNRAPQWNVSDHTAWQFANEKWERLSEGQTQVSLDIDPFWSWNCPLLKLTRRIVQFQRVFWQGGCNQQN